MLNDQSTLDVRKLITGKDGQLFIKDKDGMDIFLAEVDTFTAKVNVTNVDYQPIGSSLVYAVNTGYNMVLTLTEAVVRDEVMISNVIEDMKHGYLPSFDFAGKLRRRDGQTERIVFRNCVPESSIDLMTINPGEIVKRAWSFRVNFTPDLQESFKQV